MKKILLSSILCTFSIFLFSQDLIIHSYGEKNQKLYFKPFIRYNQSISTQVAPNYFSSIIPTFYVIPNVYGSGGGDGQEIPVMFNIKEFSLSNGLKYGGVVGYKFNEFLGVELGLEYFSANKTIGSDDRYLFPFAYTGTTYWNLKSLNCSPSFTFNKNFRRHALTAKLGALIAVTSLDNSVFIKNPYKRMSYSFNKKLSLGYNLGFEYNYYFASNFSFVIECGVENYSYTPTSARLTEYIINGRDNMQNSTSHMKEIEYRDEIKNLNVMPNSNGPEIRIKEAIRMNSIYLGMGVKFTILKDEKN